MNKNAIDINMKKKKLSVDYYNDNINNNNNSNNIKNNSHGNTNEYNGSSYVLNDLESMINAEINKEASRQKYLDNIFVETNKIKETGWYVLFFSVV